MRGRDQVYIVAASILEGQHHQGQLFGRSLLSFAELADSKVLAKYAFQVTVREKDGAGASPTDQRSFFSEMRTIAGNYGKLSGTALTFLVSQTVDITVTGTEPAIFK